MATKSPTTSSSVTIREVDWNADYARVQEIWAEGFRPIVPLYFKEVVFAPRILAIFVGVCALLSLLILRTLIWTPVFLIIVWSGCYIWFYRSVEHEIRTNGVKPPGSNFLKFWVALVDKQIVGCVGITAGRDLKPKIKDEAEKARDLTEAGKVASVWRLTVDPKFRRFGIGRQLMSHIEEYLVSQGYTEIALLAGNIDSLRFYDSLNYRRDRVAWHLGNHESIFFSKQIGPTSSTSSSPTTSPSSSSSSSS